MQLAKRARLCSFQRCRPSLLGVLIILFIKSAFALDVWQLTESSQLISEAGTAEGDLGFVFAFCGNKIKPVHGEPHLDYSHYWQDFEKMKSRLESLRAKVKVSLEATREGQTVHFREVVMATDVNIVVEIPSRDAPGGRTSLLMPTAQLPAKEIRFDMPLRDGAKFDRKASPTVVVHYTLRLIGGDNLQGHEMELSPSQKAEELREVNEAVRTATSWLTNAGRLMEGFIRDPASPSSKKVASALHKHFGWNPNTGDFLSSKLPGEIVKQVNQLSQALKGPFNARLASHRRFNLDKKTCQLRQVNASPDADCVTCMLLYPHFFERESSALPTTLLHEMLHNLNNWGDPPNSQEDESGYGSSVTGMFENPASYAGLIRDLGR